jgi:hypothetical protein
MGNIPGPQKERFYEKKYVVELIAVLPPLVTGAVGALVSLGDPAKRTLGWWLAGATGWLVLASAVKVLHAAAQDRDRKRVKQYDGLRGSLWVLYESVRRAAGLENPWDGTLRITIHRVVSAGKDHGGVEELEQLLPYVGGTGAPAGRRFSIRSGVIGKAVREKKVIAVVCESESYQGFLKELIREWAYTEDEARKLTPDRRAWMAVPILAADESVAAVVYLDSSVRDLFTPALVQLIVNGCHGTTSYVREVYS